MSDLISRSELIMHLSDYALQESPNDNESTDEQRISKMIYDAIQNCISCVEEQPTAYSIDEVVRELEIEIKTANNTYNSFNMDVDLGRVFGLERAIEIVKQGCTSDDLCEWKLEDEETNLYLTGCQQRQLIFEGTPKENGYIYCPYCGKKIKVVD